MIEKDAYQKFGKLRIFVEWYDHFTHLLFMIGCLPFALWNWDASELELYWYLLKLHIQKKGICVERGNTNWFSIKRQIVGLIILLILFFIIKHFIKP